MRNLKQMCLALFLLTFGWMAAQTGTPDDPGDHSGFRIAIRGGYDFPSYPKYDVTPYLDHKGGVMAGASLDYYWTWFGIGGDFDWLQNKAKNTFPTSDLLDPNGWAMTEFTLIENKITRMFFGIGPSFRFGITPKSDFEFKLRGGLSTTKGGEVSLTGWSTEPQAYPPILLNYHGGYDDKMVFAGKASIQYNYFFSKNVGLHLGGYYIYQNNVPDLKNSGHGFTAGYMLMRQKDLEPGSTVGYPPRDFVSRIDPLEKSIQSFGVFAGLTFTFDKTPKKAPPIPKVENCVITVIAKDKYTKEIIPNAQVVLHNESGVVQTGTTSASGSYTFEAVEKGNYTISGTYNGKELEGNTVVTTDFAECVRNGGIQRDVYLNDPTFTVMGKVVLCNSTEPIADAQVLVKNITTGATETYTSDANGIFTFNGQPNTKYSIYAKKANHMSQTMVVSTGDYNRSQSAFIQLQICMEKVDCGEAIVLKDILYDLNKSFIRDDAKPELNRLVQFMKDNPDVKVELSSHTDSRASDAYNMKLSQRRAQAAVDYIVSEGISKSRLIAKGYGERHLLNGCKDGVKCTEEEHQLNRRTEMKVICPNQK